MGSGAILELCRRAVAASRAVAVLAPQAKAALVRSMADALRGRAAAIEAANAEDVRDAGRAGIGGALRERLQLDGPRIVAMAEGVGQVADLPDPVGRELEVRRRPSGLVIRKVSVPLGVLAVIYEARPAVTADAAALALMAGNAVILRGGSEAARSNRAILDALLAGGAAAGMPEHAVQMLSGTDRAAVHELLAMEGYIDLVIPRGGESLIRAVAEHARVPVLKHYKGVCHVYVDRAADLAMAERIVINAKCQRPGVCNAMETMLVHAAVAGSFLPAAGRALSDHGVELRGDERTRAILPQAVPIAENDWSNEYLDLIMNVAVVGTLDDAIEHVNRWGTHHTDVIVTGDRAAAGRFAQRVDSATVCVNASSRFADGYEFGFGAEIGISTDKLHARGPCGLEALTTYKYVVEGSGQVRQ